MSLDRQIEAVLFYQAEPIKKSKLLKLFPVSEDELSEALRVLESRLGEGATTLISTTDTVELALAPEFDELIEGLRKEELKRDIGKAGAETLAIVLYRGPITRVDLDRIRGVNSSYILRNLEIRGLVERTTGVRQNEYRPTTDLLRHLGISEKTQMPDYASVMNALENFELQKEENG